MIIEKHTVPDKYDGLSLYDFSREMMETITSGKGVKKAIKRGEILLQGTVVNPLTKVSSGQIVELVFKERIRKVYPLDLEVLFEDDYLAIVDKPAGILVNGNRFKTIENALPHNLKVPDQRDRLSTPLPVHRLDFETTGLLLVAKTRSMAEQLSRLFEEGLVRKRYRAVVIGETAKEGEVIKEVEGKEAITRFKAVESLHSWSYGHLTKLDLFPETGRKHQLRVHLSGHGTPILGDRKYSTGKNLWGKGLFLTAVQLEFDHPVTGERLGVQREEPPKFSLVMDREYKRWKRVN